MKLRKDVVRMYKEIHGWVGIIAGLALFVAFYAGAITMFEEPLQRWASPPSTLAPPPSLERTPELVAKAIVAHPEAAHDYDIHVRTGPDQPARMSWHAKGGGREHDFQRNFYAGLAADGSLQIESDGPSPVAQFVDILHQRVGLPLSDPVARPIMGIISLLYVIAIVSGIIVLLPSLVSDLFALRITARNVKRMWLDVHNVLGIFSLPFHIVMALTAIVFAFHDQFYDAQELAFAHRESRPPRSAPAAAAQGALLTPAEILARLGRQAPGFAISTMSFGQGKDGRATLRVQGEDPRYGHRGPTFGIAGVDPYSGKIIATDYMPGRQDGWGAAISGFFTLHFGSYGGAPIRWAYFLLGIGGAFLFYTGNLLWIESRRRRERKAGAVEQSRATRILGALTVGVPLGCVGGISVTVAAAKLLGAAGSPGVHGAVYYAVFLAFTAWALLRGAGRAGVELIGAASASMLAIPLATLIAGPAWYPDRSVLLVDLVALAVAGLLLLGLSSARRRFAEGPRDSVWSRPAVDTQA